jgi:RNA polymerase sigma-70 factor (ECF subfamily)
VPFKGMIVEGCVPDGGAVVARMAEDAVDHEQRFHTFVRAAERRVWLALVSELGPDGADDAVAQGFAHAWQHWGRVSAMANPAGYVYRVAQRAGREVARRSARSYPLMPPELARQPDVEPELGAALAALSPNQARAVFLIEACGWTLAEAAELLGVSVSTVRNHLARGMAGLREHLEVELDV